MFEVLAIAVGVGLGASLRRLSRARAIAVMVALGVPLGACISALAGELELSVGFVVFDALQVTAAAALTYGCVFAVTAARTDGPLRARSPDTARTGARWRPLR